MSFDSPALWLTLAQIIWINLLLSGDNAVVIALACRALPKRTRTLGIVLGAGAAVVLRILFTGIVAVLLTLPWLKVAGAAALLWIAVSLAIPDDGEGEEVAASENLWKAIGTVAAADAVMSLDNVVAVAAIVHGNWILLVLGLVISIPLIVAGSSLVMAVLERFPLLIWAGAALLGWVAGEMLLTDVALMDHLGPEVLEGLDTIVPPLAATLVVALAFAIGFWRRRTSDA